MKAHTYLVLMSLVFCPGAGALLASQETSLIPFRHAGLPSCFSLSSDGSRVAIGFDGWTVWDIQTGKQCGTAEVSLTDALAFSPDGKYLADTNLRIMEVSTGNVLWDLSKRAYLSSSVTDVAFTSDAKYFVALAGADRMVRIWNVKERKTHAFFYFNDSETWNRLLGWWKRARNPNTLLDDAKFAVNLGEDITFIRFALSPDSKTIAFVLGPSEVRAFDLETGKAVKTFQTSQAGAVALRFSDDGSLLAIGGNSEKGTIEIWDVQQRKRLTTLLGHQGSVTHLAISPDNQTIVSGGDIDGARVWDVGSGKQKFRYYQDKGRDIACLGVGFLADGQTFLTMMAERGSAVQFWDTATGRQVSGVGRRVNKNIKLRAAPPLEEAWPQLGNLGYNYAFALSPSRGKLAIGSFDGHQFLGPFGSWTIWDIKTRKKVLTGDTAGTSSLAFSHDEKFLAVLDQKQFKVIEIATGKVCWDFLGDAPVAAVSWFTPDGKYALLSDPLGILRLWNLKSKTTEGFYCFNYPPYTDKWKEFFKTWKAANPDKLPDNAKFLVDFGERGGILAVAPDGRTIACTLGTAEVKFMELATGKVLRTLATGEPPSGVGRFSDDGTLLAFAGSKKATIEVWDVARGKRLATLAGHKQAVCHLAISPDNKTIVSAGHEDGICVWDVATGKEKFAYHRDKGHESRCVGVGFLPGGKTFLTLMSERDSAVQFWDTATGREVPLIELSSVR